MYVDARIGGRPPRPRKEGAAAQTGKVPGVEVGRGLRLVQRPVPGWLGRGEMRPPTFACGAEDLVFYGQTSRGKTRIATAIGIVATSTGYSARFWQTAQLALQLGKAKREDTLDGLLAGKGKARSLVLDEFG